MLTEWIVWPAICSASGQRNSMNAYVRIKQSWFAHENFVTHSLQLVFLMSGQTQESGLSLPILWKSRAWNSRVRSHVQKAPPVQTASSCNQQSNNLIHQMISTLFKLIGRSFWRDGSLKSSNWACQQQKALQQLSVVRAVRQPTNGDSSGLSNGLIAAERSLYLPLNAF